MDCPTRDLAEDGMHRPVDAAQLSALLLVLYELARQPSVHEFQKRAVQCLRSHVDFDSAFWGTGTIGAGRQHVHSAYAWNIPADTLPLLNLMENRNIVARACSENPGLAHAFQAAALQADVETAQLVSYQGMRQLCCIATIERSSGLTAILCIARQVDVPAFGQAACAWLELLMPHLNRMLNLTRISQMEHIRSARASQHTRMAVTDVKGVLHVMEPGFDQLLLEEWPDWSGPLLPKALIGRDPGQPHRYSGRQLLSEADDVAEQLLVTLVRRRPTDSLTDKERGIALAYTSGHSHKEVAQQLGMAPATVRHYLREVYAKLGVGDKASLARILHTDG